ncbi:glycoside hydrolase superfamily [Multifurca ochricompacta]|uniref:Alpha-galactosidase n=1 Tax=Multifurca ochricompacta TaxID=376703 RepID=A0AAD4QQS4_9AGAM|nr:glycoside hydrolase superfamily [Multifurca ochricompacta]
MRSWLPEASDLVPSVFSQNIAYAQCGGFGWTGPTTCISGYTCVFFDTQYSQCLPETATNSSFPLPSTNAHSAISSSISCLDPALTSVTAAVSTAVPSKAVGRLPALGWNTWNAYRCAISANKVLAAAQSFVRLGLREAGYEYINIDDCWAMLDRNPETNEQVPDPVKFPNGIKSLADKIHSLGLKIGIYSDAGTETCAGYPGSLGFESVDAAMWQSWGIDYNCNVPGNWSDTHVIGSEFDLSNSKSAIRFRKMGDAIANNDPPMQFSLCIWGEAHVWAWGARVGHSWRMSGDSRCPNLEVIKSIISFNVGKLSSVDFFAHNDMDMMEIGNGNLTIQEEKTHFAVWAFMKSPILLGSDLERLSPAQVKIITNSELIAFHQDATVGKPALPFTPSTSARTEPPQFYSGMSSRGCHVFIVNTNDHSTTFTLDFTDVPGLNSSSVNVRDMWTFTDVGCFLATIMSL